MASQMIMQKYGWPANFIENHDQPRAASKYLKEAQDNKDAVKMMGAMYFFLRGVPFIYQGQELGMVNFERTSMEQFNDLSSIDQYQRSLEEGLSKEEALRIVNLRSWGQCKDAVSVECRKVRRITDGTPWLSMTEEYPRINAEAQKGKEGSIYEFYKEMIAFRQHGPLWR